MSLIRKGDTVEVIAGAHKGERGKVLEVLRREDRVIVEGVNLRVHHERVRPTKDGGQTGGRVEKEGPIHLSNVMYVHRDRPVRLGAQVEEGRKHRVVRGSEFGGEKIED
jgi:large subunit ribosomal protein L24